MAIDSIGSAGIYSGRLPYVAKVGGVTGRCVVPGVALCDGQFDYWRNPVVAPVSSG